MGKSSKWLALMLVFALALSAVALVGCGDGEEGMAAEKPSTRFVEDGKLIAGSDTAFPPFEFLEGSEVKGFDVDLLTEIASRMASRKSSSRPRSSTRSSRRSRPAASST